jgi:hypothetical protein
MQLCRDASFMSMRRRIRGLSAEEIKNLPKGKSKCVCVWVRMCACICVRVALRVCGIHLRCFHTHLQSLREVVSHVAFAKRLPQQ